MFKKIKPNLTLHGCLAQFPHRDQRILHAPGECQFCDKHSDWQDLRIQWGIAFTGYEPEGTELPCPADYARGDNHTKWFGNTAKPANKLKFVWEQDETTGQWFYKEIDDDPEAC